MSGDINVLSRTQFIQVDPASGSVSITNAGPVGPALEGPAGPGLVWRGAWASGTPYAYRDVVSYNGSMYVAKADVTSATGPVNDTVNWDVAAKGFNYRGQWAAGSAYRINDVVYSGGSLFIAITNHTSVALADPMVSTANWARITQGYTEKGTWASGSVYRVYDVVEYNGSVWLCIGNHTAGAGDTPSANVGSLWTLFVRGWNWRGAWVSGTVYRTSDVVSYNGSTYRTTGDITTAPGTTTAPDTNASWSLVAQKGDRGDAVLGYSESRPGTNTVSPPAGYTANTWYDVGPSVTFTAPAGVTAVKATFSIYVNANSATTVTAILLWGLRTAANALVASSDHRAAGAGSGTAAYAGKITSTIVVPVVAGTTYTWKWSVQVNVAATWNQTAGAQFPATMIVEAL